MRRTLARSSTRTEIAVGRALAMCVHPYAAWRTRSKSGRLLVFFTYFAVGYAVVLTSLLVF